ncbi:MAG: aminodeoxychorismate synthase component I [Clostridia bacterium]|nr:MAG: aminodeoxychorismate synthase component I [Clostridia bacterium]
MSDPPLSVEKLDLPPLPHLLFTRLYQPGRYGFLLESSLTDNRLGRYSFLGNEPFLVFRAKGEWCELAWEDGTSWQGKVHPLEVLDRLLGRFQRTERHQLFPFTGGAVGYLGYDLGRVLEKLPATADDDLGLPDLYLCFYHTLVAVDHLNGEVYLVSARLPELTSSRSFTERARKMSARLRGPGFGGYNIPGADISLAGCRKVGPGGGVEAAAGEGAPPLLAAEMLAAGLVQANFTREEYCRAVQRVKDYIAAGDIFQANLSQRLVAPWPEDPYALFLRLRAVNPAPFAAFLAYPEVSVVSSSPERFLQVKDRQVETRPIKGTRPRGATPEQDRRLREELWQSEKDRAELVMIVDLERNDLGRVCRYGSVRVPELLVLEEYASVFHLVATVTGTLRPGAGLADLIRATSPGGSITGAPKVRAMEIIEELEPVRRGIYTGSIGWLGFNGDADLNIAIRTFVVKDRLAYFQVGGGIVADSTSAAEYDETLHKAQGLAIALSKYCNSAKIV